jgi:hypothetical protein
MRYTALARNQASRREADTGSRSVMSRSAIICSILARRRHFVVRSRSLQRNDTTRVVGERKDANGENLFPGGFLGMDNIGVFDRSQILPGGSTLRPRLDGVLWCLLLRFFRAIRCRWRGDR